MGQRLSGDEGRVYSNDGVVFSLLNGFVWASWPGASGSVRLGSHDMVVEMMRDFIAQSELAERLNGGSEARPVRKRATG